MLGIDFLPLVFKYITRRRIRSALTISGVATAMFLFYAVDAMHQGVKEATEQTAKDTKLVVYRQDRYCPFSSMLPQDYGARIAAISGVKAVVPVKVFVNNCRTGLDVVTFRGIPATSFEEGFFAQVRLREGSLENWKKRNDSALVGERLAKRRGLRVGDQMEIGGMTISVAGILDSPEPQDQNVAYTHLEFVQRATDNKVGIVTQFNIAVNDPSQLGRVAKAIDDEFQYSQDPTSTWSEKHFIARSVTDIIEIVNFARWLGWSCVAGIFALVFNAIILSVRDRVRDHAVMQTLGYSQGLIAGLIIIEGMILSLSGGLVGVLAGAILTSWGGFSLSVEGLSVHVHAGLGSVLLGLGLSALIGVLAGLAPAWQASRHDIAASFRAV
jgi:putative ABC transport system permease protein